MHICAYNTLMTCQHTVTLTCSYRPMGNSPHPVVSKGPWVVVTVTSDGTEGTCGCVCACRLTRMAMLKRCTVPCHTHGTLCCHPLDAGYRVR